MKAVRLRIWIGMFLLLFVEQAIKLVINSFFLDKDIPILPTVVHFNPMFNRDYSWFNSMLQLGVGKWLHIAIVFLMIAMIFKFYVYLCHRSFRDPAIDSIFIFVFSGAMCSLMDKVFWNGSLDYIELKGFFTFDLKDVYVNVSIGLLLFFMIKGNKKIKSILEDKTLMKGFTQTVFHGNKSLRETGDNSRDGM